MYQRIEFDSMKDFVTFVFQNKIQEIGHGAEGTAYLMKNGRIMKCLNVEHQITPERQERLLTANDTILEHIYLPQNLYVINGNIVGYDATYFKHNIFRKGNKGVIDKDMAIRILQARERLLVDIRRLTELNYYLYDLRGNLLFDGENFCVIDTINYKYDPNIRVFTNTISIDYAILYRLNKYDESFDFNIGEQVKLCLKRNNRI